MLLKRFDWYHQPYDRLIVEIAAIARPASQGHLIRWQKALDAESIDKALSAHASSAQFLKEGMDILWQAVPAEAESWSD